MTDNATEQLARMVAILRDAGIAIGAAQITTRVGKRSISVAVEVAEVIEPFAEQTERRH